jgi:hypothetical protein
MKGIISTGSVSNFEECSDLAHVAAEVNAFACECKNYSGCKANPYCR